MNQAIYTAPGAKGNLTLQEVPTPQLQPHEAMVQVDCISINRGEAYVTQFAPEGLHLGWDFAGTVTVSAADGTGPQVGSRVVGLLPMGAWARQIAASAQHLCEVPEGVALHQVAALPVAGLTAHFSLQKAGNLQHKKVLVTGANGGVGHLAVQLACLQGAEVTAQIRNPAHQEQVQRLGAAEVLCGPVGGDGGPGIYNAIFDGVGGEGFQALPALLKPGGTLVSYGASAGNPVQLDLMPFTMTGGLSLHGVALFHELQQDPTGAALNELVHLLGQGKLQILVEKHTSWKEVGTVAEDLLERRFSGKAVLQVD